MFCGWQLYSDYERLARLHEGTLVLNVLNKKCFFNQEPTKPLDIVLALHNWLIHDLKSHDIAIEAIDEAILDIEFDVSRDPRSRRGVTIINHNFTCFGRIRSGEDSYICKFRDRSGKQEIIENYHRTS